MSYFTFTFWGEKIVRLFMNGQAIFSYYLIVRFYDFVNVCVRENGAKLFDFSLSFLVFYRFHEIKDIFAIESSACNFIV